MKKFLTSLASLALTLAVTACSGAASQNSKTMTDTQNNTASNGDVIVDMKTTMGDIKLRLFGDTPRHRDNFVKLVNEGFYNGVLFHRVINDFMVQTGDPNSRDAQAGKMLGEGDPGYTIEAEIDYPRHFHHRGALAAARTGDNVNPERRSSGSQFYIVTGQTYNDSTMTQMEKRMEMQAMQDAFNRLALAHRDSIMEMRRNRDQAGLQALQEKLAKEAEAEVAKNPVKITDEVRKAYTTEGGTPHLDGAYTVFGEVISGMDVVDKIQKVETDRNDRPKDDVRIISMTVEK